VPVLALILAPHRGRYRTFVLKRTRDRDSSFKEPEKRLGGGSWGGASAREAGGASVVTWDGSWECFAPVGWVGWEIRGAVRHP
jgi:hypothetical protein